MEVETPIIKSERFNRQDIYLSIILSIIVFAVYFDVISHDFISFDDSLNVTENPHIRTGLSIENIKWAFKFTQKGDQHYWHPLTSISHMLDCHFFGLNPAGHLLNNLFLHIANTLLLYILLFKMTCARWKSAFVALLFALHPMNVESVAWVAERKNVLSSFFWFLTMLLYLGFAKKRTILKYFFIMISMLLGLLCKPILVTLPCVLLLMDIWPLKRIPIVFSKSGILNLFFVVIEKLPLLALSAFWTYLSSLSMERLEVTISYEAIPMNLRIANALISYVQYLWKIIWPFNLAIYYPFPSEMPPLWQVYGSALFLAVISTLSIAAVQKKPWLTVGWFWYIGMLFPVIGLVQNGLWPEMADRWTYIPHIGIFIMISWSLSDLFTRWYQKKKIPVLILTGFSLILVFITGTQVRYWKDNKTLFEHAVNATTDNAIAHNNLAGALIKQGKTEKGISHYEQAITINPGFKQAYFNLGKVLASQKKYEEAIQFLKQSIQIDPNYEEAYHNIGAIQMMQGRNEQAVDFFYQAITINPGFAISHYNLGILLANKGNLDGSIKHLSEAVKIKHDFTEAKDKLNLAMKIRDKIKAETDKMIVQLQSDPQNAFGHYKISMLYRKINEVDKAAAHLNQALAIQPDYIEALNELALIQIEQKEYQKAISNLKKLLKLQPENANISYNIACLYSRQNKAEPAIQWLKKAIDKGYKNWQLIETDRDLDAIRNEPEYQKIIDIIKKKNIADCSKNNNDAFVKSQHFDGKEKSSSSRRANLEEYCASGSRRRV